MTLSLTHSLGDLDEEVNRLSYMYTVKFVVRPRISTHMQPEHLHININHHKRLRTLHEYIIMDVRTRLLLGWLGVLWNPQNLNLVDISIITNSSTGGCCLLISPADDSGGCNYRHVVTGTRSNICTDYIMCLTSSAPVKFS